MFLFALFEGETNELAEIVSDFFGGNLTPLELKRFGFPDLGLTNAVLLNEPLLWVRVFWKIPAFVLD